MSDDRLAVFHRSEEDARSPGAAATLRGWQAHELPVEVVAFLPAPQDALSRTFGRECVERAFATDTDAAQASAVACGSLLAAARHARDSRVGVACSLADTHGGPFDALAFATAWLTARAVRVAMLDCRPDSGASSTPGGLRFIAAVAPDAAPAPPDIVDPQSGVRFRHSRPAFDALLGRLHPALEEMEQAGVELLLYRSGASGSPLSAIEQASRDRFVWEQTARRGIAVAWNPICDASADAVTSCRQSVEGLCRLITNATRLQFMHHGRKRRALSVEGR